MYEDGPYTFCDDFGCTCAAPQIDVAAMQALSSLPQDPGRYWPAAGNTEGS
jgi:hypothetical protein